MLSINPETRHFPSATHCSWPHCASHADKPSHDRDAVRRRERKPERRGPSCAKASPRASRPGRSRCVQPPRESRRKRHLRAPRRGRSRHHRRTHPEGPRSDGNPIRATDSAASRFRSTPRPRGRLDAATIVRRGVFPSERVKQTVVWWQVTGLTPLREARPARALSSTPA